ncbi:hypothetical protein [Rubrivirga sp.]|uniref:hypothetical protein n=1 Tax=Rubrivirga sp. TaxID=1885344 RepID=UPI003C75AD7A
MTRFLSLALLAFGLTTVASAQTTDPTEMPAVEADTVVADSLEAAIEPDPERARELYQEGIELFRESNFSDALLKYEEALLYNETYAPAGLGLAQALAQEGRLEDSRNAFEDAVAMAEASDASNAGTILSAANRGLEQVSGVLEARAAQAAAAQEQQAAASAAAETTAKIEQAVQMLNGNDITYEQGTDAYALLEQARMAGYDADLVAFYYAKALIAMERGADAVPYAETALAASEGQADRSSFYIQLGLAHMGAGDADQARAAFESIAEGQAWHGWAQHYIGQLDS